MKRNGFTFIELLVSITIIGLMLAIVTLSFRGANRNARDSRRQADLQEVRGAIESYRLEQGSYPPTNDNSSDTVFMNELQPDYLSKNIVDPVNSTPNFYYYRYIGTASCNYILYAPMEVEGNASPCPTTCGVSVGSGVYCLAN